MSPLAMACVTVEIPRTYKKGIVSKAIPLYIRKKIKENKGKKGGGEVGLSYL